MTELVLRDVQQADGDTAWIKMIIPDGSTPGVVAGTVALWSHEDSGTAMSEIGWMVLPEFTRSAPITGSSAPPPT